MGKKNKQLDISRVKMPEDKLHRERGGKTFQYQGKGVAGRFKEGIEAQLCYGKDTWSKGGTSELLGASSFQEVIKI